LRLANNTQYGDNLKNSIGRARVSNSDVVWTETKEVRPFLFCAFLSFRPSIQRQLPLPDATLAYAAAKAALSN
jgi:hypothetical protein